jgi:hypothetical protein
MNDAREGDERHSDALYGPKVLGGASRYWRCQEQDVLMRIRTGAAPLRADPDPIRRAPAKK